MSDKNTVTVRLAGGGTMVVSKDRAEVVKRTMAERHRFSVDYCNENGWPTDAASLTIEQIMGIRSQPGWKAAGR